MQWDLGLQGLGLLVAMSLGFGVLAQLIAGKRTTRRLWLIASAAAFVGGLLTSEVWFGWATEEELQPNIDGLSFDEALLGALISAVVAVLVTRYAIRKRPVEPDDRAERERGETKPHALSGTGT
jgi:ABC-type transporter Mla maintaining outer membrane lipid asymmetry permease subunit MlaE